MLRVDLGSFESFNYSGHVTEIFSIFKRLKLFNRMFALQTGGLTFDRYGGLADMKDQLKKTLSCMKGSVWSSFLDNKIY